MGTCLYPIGSARSPEVVSCRVVFPEEIEKSSKLKGLDVTIKQSLGKQRPAKNGAGDDGEAVLIDHQTVSVYSFLLNQNTKELLGVTYTAA